MTKNLNEFVDILENNQALLRIKHFVNPVLEISEITDRISKSYKGGKALLFENTGTKFPVLTNAFGSDKRISLALYHNSLSDIASKINKILKQVTKPHNTFSDKISALSLLKNFSNFLPKKVKKASSQDIIIKNPNLNILPILKTWPLDGGKFITLPLVNTKDPISGIRNLGMYRMQVLDSKTTAMHWHKHKVAARHFFEYKKLQKKMPIAVAIGGDPVYTYAATAPLPDNVDEYMLAGFLRNKNVKLVDAITQDIEVPADADFIIEGYIDPTEKFIIEGPFGDHTGFYSLEDYYPKFHITCITHKKNPIYPATLVGIPPQEDLYFAKATEKIFLPLLQKSIAPEIIDLHLPQPGVAHNFTSVKINSLYEGQAFKVMNSLWGNGQMALNKCLFVTDLDVELTNYKQFAQKCLKNFDPKNDIFYSKGPADVLDHSSDKFALGSKIGFDFTNKNQSQLSQKKDFCKNDIKKHFSCIDNFTSLLNFDIPILIVSIKKNKKISDFFADFIEKINTSAFKIIIFVDHVFNSSDFYYVAWITGNNIEPLRDTGVAESTKFKNTIMFVDATKKTPETDNFKRKWPQFTIMNTKTINKIDNIWNKLNIGEFINSPSLKFKF